MVFLKVKRLFNENPWKQSQSFSFAIAREFEMAKDPVMTAAFLSKVNEEGSQGDNDIYWESMKRADYRYNLHYNYFSYLDLVMTSSQMESVLKATKARIDAPYEKWLYAKLEKDVYKVQDLLGTKYMRETRLAEAEKAFSDIPVDLWKNTYEYGYMLNANPFYTNMYNEHKTIKADSISYTKFELVKTLRDLLKKANDPNYKNRDEAYFKVANCF